MSLLDCEGLGQYRVGPILPLKPVCGIGDAHEMRSHLWLEMCGHWNSRGARDRCRPQPSGATANAHELGHYIVARASKHCLIQHAGTVEVLPELNRWSRRTRQLVVPR